MIRRLALFALLAGCSAPTRFARSPHPDAFVLRVVTYNVNFGIPGDEPTLAAIAEADGDVVLLQETNRTWEAALIRAMGDRYPWREFEHRAAAGGAAVLSKYEIDSVEILQPSHRSSALRLPSSSLSPSAEGGWFPAMRATIKLPTGRMQLLNVHLRPQLSDSGSVVSGFFSTPAIRAEEIDGFTAKLDPKLPTLIAGDFNESASGRATDRLLDRGFVDALHEFDPDAETWRWPTSLGQIEGSFDRILYRPDDGLEPIGAKVLPRGGSDHLPVVAIFEIAVAS